MRATFRAARRTWLARAGANALALLVGGCASSARSRARRSVVVVGGGYGGATAARYLALWGGASVQVTLIEADARFVSCPLSNLVLGGSKSIDDITRDYDGLARHGVRVVNDRATAIDHDRHEVRLSRGDAVAYEHVVVSPGIDFLFERIGGLRSADARERVLHAYKAGPQTVALRKQIEAMPDGGVFAISIPRAPYRCPPAPYERACQVAWYFRLAKPRSKVLVLDANEEVQSKKALFERAWREDYPGMVEYRPDCVLTDVDSATLTARFEVAEDVRADVLNVIPPHGAAAIARSAGLVTANDQWCEVDFLTFESVRAPGIHVLGDAIQIAPLMPKSGHMANQHGKVAASAILAQLFDLPLDRSQVISNTCYSFITDREAVHVASVHAYDPMQKTFVTVPGSGGLSAAKSELEGRYGFAWAQSIWNDMLS